MALTGKLDWSLIRWIKNNVLTKDSACVFTIYVWTYKYGAKRIQVEASDGEYAEDAYAYASVVTDFEEDCYQGFEVNEYSSTNYRDEFIRQFIAKFYTLKNAIILSIGTGGVGENTLWGNPWREDKMADKYATVIQQFWRDKHFTIK